MTASKSLPPRPSLESLRKQAKKLARDTAAGDASAIARARVQLPGVDLPLTQRNAQLVIAREYRLRRLARPHRRSEQTSRQQSGVGGSNRLDASFTTTTSNA